MKILICGVGGVGSFFTEEVVECIKQGQIDAEITIADMDIVEIEQIKYQNFSVEEVGMNKAKALAKRYEDYGIKFIDKRIERVSQLKDFDIIILCVDNDKTREFVVRYCHKNNKEFLDLRATGRRIFAMPKLSLKENLKFINSQDKTEYSCQERYDLERGYIQKGNKIVAMVGIQMLLNLIRGHTNKPISIVV